MITFSILFFAVLTTASAVFSVLIANTHAIYSILAIIIFLTLTLTYIKQTRKLAWTGFILAVILYSAVGILTPHVRFITYLIAFGVSIPCTLIFRKHLIKFLKQNDKSIQKLPIWFKFIIKLL